MEVHLYHHCILSLRNILTHIPVCEAQQCPVIHVEQNVQVIGDPEEATYGNVVQFSCKSRTEILSGSQEMYCDENGEWRGQVPKCKEITCAVPEIENGFVSGDIPEYEENEVLYFRCDATYKRTVGRPSKCIKQGNRAEWSPTPACESIRCRLTLPPQEGTRYQSPSRIVFPPGDTLRVMCGNKYWISHPRETSAVTTCKEDGEWTFHPVCQAITCNSQSYEEADIEGEVKTIYGYREQVHYTCKAGSEGRFTLTCEKAGWIGTPRCTTPLGCGTSPPLTDGDTTGALRFQHRHEERVQYRCQNYYIMEGEPYKTCMNGEWIGQIRCLKPCTVDEEAMRSHNIEFRYGSEHKRYSHHNDYITFSCTERRIPVGTSGMRFQCVDGEMHLPTCQ
ncbi:complement factor H-related protein 2-like [Anarhichas minor]|uniref:complement factor H-related protein 2-like n=1 Tax=Anarhichas minor TaxID=65739 RepID=UPI003F738F08